MSNLDARMAAAMAYSWNPAAKSLFAQRDEFMVRAQAFGLTLEQAETIFRSEGLLTSISGRQGGAYARLEYFAEHGYLTVLLGEVLTQEEVAAQPFGYRTVLNGQRWMDRPYAKHFAEMDRDRQRALVKAAIELTTQLGGAEQGWPLERAMAVVMPYVEGL